MHKVLYIGFVLFLSLPVLNQITDLVTIKTLHGYVEEESEEEIAVSFQSFFSSKWQEMISKNADNETNSRPAFIRCRNYFDYSLFDIVHVNSVFKGKNDYLFYGKEYYMRGEDKKPLAIMQNNVLKLKMVQDSLEREGKQLLYVIAPEKMFVYPEFLPDRYSLTKEMRFSYDNYISLFESNEIEYIDFNKWFIDLKRENEYALFAKGGKHWTQYYATIAADSIGDVLRANNCNISDFEYIETVDTGKIFGEDMDTWKSANLPYSYEEETIAKAKFNIDDGKKDDVIVVADSYFHAIDWKGIFRMQYGEKSEFWYYNKNRHDINDVPLGETSQEVFDEKEVKAYVILISVGNISSFDFGFIDYF